MGRTMPIWVAAVALVFGAIGCVSTSIPSTSPDAVSTIVAATLGAITPAATATAVASTYAPLPTPSNSSVPPTLPPVAPPIQVPSAIRITFLNGATTGVVSAPMPVGQVQTYVLQAFQGQPMLVNVDSLNQDVTLSIKTQGGTSMLNAASHETSWEGTLPQTEDYYLTVHAGATTENFTLTITIPSRIKFPEGGDSAKVSGKTVGGYSVTYTVFAIKGQKMSVDLAGLSGDVALTIYGFTDGQPYLRSVTEQDSFSFKLPSTQDYIVEVVPKGGGVVSYLMTIQIQ